VLDLDSLDVEREIPERALGLYREAMQRNEAMVQKRRENEREWRRRKTHILDTQNELRRDMKRKMRQRMLEIEEEKEQKLRELIERERHKMQLAQQHIDQKRRLLKDERKKRDRQRKIQRQKSHFKRQEYEKISEQFLIRQREKIQELDLDRVTVALRIAPLRDNLRAHRAISQLSENILQVKRVVPRHFDKGSRVVVDRFQFDHVWSGSYPLHGLIHKHIGRKVVTAAVNGINSTVFSFGQSSTGKTHLMFGPYAPAGSNDVNTDEALIPMIGMDLFNELQQSYENRWEVHVSFIEIYQERTRDLLSENEEYIANSVYETQSGQMQVKGVRRYKVQKYEDLKHLINIGSAQRHTETTKLNLTSSRSHAVLSLFITYSPLERSKDYIVQTETNLVDLAGFERVGAGVKSQPAQVGGTKKRTAKDGGITAQGVGSTLSPHGGPTLPAAMQTPNDDYLFGEGVTINKSLLELGICLQKMAEMTANSASTSARFSQTKQFVQDDNANVTQLDYAQKFLSTRSSTLTWLLKNSLVGKAKVFMLGTVSPLKEYVNESLTTLFYTSQAVNISTPVPSKKSSVKPQPVWQAVIRSVFTKIITQYNRYTDLKALHHHNDVKYKKTVRKLKKLVAKVVMLIKYKSMDLGKEIVAQVLEKEFAHQAEFNSKREFNTLLYLIALQFPKNYWEFIDHNKLDAAHRKEDAEIYESKFHSTETGKPYDENGMISEEMQEGEASAFDFRKHLM